MTQAAKEAQERVYEALNTYSRALLHIVMACESLEEAKAIANAAIYEVSDVIENGGKK